MARPVTLFTGQWADLPIDELAARCGACCLSGNGPYERQLTL